MLHRPQLRRGRFFRQLSYAANIVNPSPIWQDYRSTGVENVHWCWYAEPDFPEKLMPHITSDNLYFTLDVKQAAQAGHDPSDYIAPAAGRLVNVHLCDFERSATKGIIPRLPFEGELDIGRFRCDLQQSGYDGGVILEVYSHNYKDLPQLQRCYERVADFFSKPV